MDNGQWIMDSYTTKSLPQDPFPAPVGSWLRIDYLMVIFMAEMVVNWKRMFYNRW